MRAGIAEPLRGRADLRRGGGRHPVGLGVDVGRRHDRHSGRVRDRTHCRAASALGHSYTVAVYRYTSRGKACSGEATSRATSRDASRATDRDATSRDAPTWLSYSALAAYAFWLYAFGPALALLREE